MNHLKYSGLNEFIMQFDIHIIIGFYKGITIFTWQMHTKLSRFCFCRCVDSLVKILVNTAHTIIFTSDDTLINRVEFIIRRCDGVRIFLKYN